MIVPFSTLMSNLAVTSAPVTESYALMSAALTSNLSASYVSDTPTYWMLLASVNLVVSSHTWYTNLEPRLTVLVFKFSGSLLFVLSTYGSAFVSVYSFVNSSSSSINFLPVMSYFSLETTNFSGWNSGVSGGVTLLLNSLSAVPSVALPLASTPPVDVTFVTVVNV